MLISLIIINANFGSYAELIKKPANPENTLSLEEKIDLLQEDNISQENEEVKEVLTDKTINKELDLKEKLVLDNSLSEETTGKKEYIDENAGQIKEDKAIVLISKVDSITITVTAEAGVLPKDAILYVKPIEQKVSQNYSKVIEENKGTNLDKFIAFDITILDSEGKEIQPDGQVEVSFDGLEFIKDSKEVAVYYLDYNLDEKDLQSKILSTDINIDEMDSTHIDDLVTFSTNHFSIYGVGTKTTATYTFKVDGVEVDKQIVLDGEKLEEPKTPVKKEKKRFIGWYIEGQTSAINFKNPVTVSESKTYTVNAKFEDILYVYFKYNDNIIKTKEVAPGGKTNDSEVPIVIIEEGKTLDYWSAIPNGPAFNFNNPITDNTTLYAVLVNRWKVTFDSRGGSSLLPKYIENKTMLGAVDTPVRAGYSFQGWYTGINGTGTKYISNTVINSKITLYASWKAETVNYSIKYWRENADDTDYTYEETLTATGLSGGSIVLTTAQKKTYDYFTYKANDMGKIIKGDGTTVVNVYYSRNSYTLKFNLNKTNAKLTIGGKTYTGSNYEFTAKYESDISALWPTALNIPNVVNDKFTSWGSTNPTSTQASKVLVLTSNYISTTGTKNFTANWSTAVVEYKLHYMIERLPEEPSKPGDKEYGTGASKKWYSEDSDYYQAVNYAASTTWGAKQLPGVINVGIQQASGKNGGDVYFYYDRNTYDINFYNPTLLHKKVTLKYGSSIENQNYTPPRPTGISSENVFMGWYTNIEGIGNAFKFVAGKMPENNLALYSKWARPEYTVKFYVTQDDGGEIKIIENIADGETINEDMLAKEIPDGLTEVDFIGWYWYIDGIFVPYDFNTPVISNNYILYPVWRNIVYTVKYDKGLGIGIVPLDTNKYYLGSSANVSEPVGLTGPNDKVFIGWKNDSTNKVYYPNDKLNITGNMTLTAQWGDIVPDTTLTYKGNGGIGTELAITLKNNSIHDVLENIFTREGYQFIGWNTKADGSGDLFKGKDKIIVGNSTPVPNVLYAQWISKIDIAVQKRWQGDDDYIIKRPQDVEVQLFKDGLAFGEPIKMTSEKSWKHIFKALEPINKDGKKIVYTIKELSLKDYNTVISGNQDQGFIIINTLKVGALEITKMDGRTKEIITTGAEFELRDESGRIIKTFTTGIDGKYKLENLVLGKYILTETKAPTFIDGEGKQKSYNILTKPIEVEITISGELKQLKVDNYKSGWILPTTGGSGTFIYYSFGTLFILLSAILLIGRRKKHLKGN